MRQVQITVPEEFDGEVDEVLDQYTNDITSNEAEKQGTEVIEFTATVDDDEIDELTEDLKETDIESGDLYIRVLEQESLIEKGQKTKGSASLLSQEEIYSKAQEFSGFSKAQWALVGLSSAIAAYGLILNNLIVVIGAMMLAPMLSPLVSGAISMVIGDSKLMKKSLVSGLMSFLLAIAISYIAVLPFPVTMNSALQTIVSFGFPVIILSFLVGAAAAFTFATGFRDQIAGVAVAVALVPPLAASGIGLRIQNPVYALHASSIAAINILAVLISGYVSFKAIGLSPTSYYKQKEADKLRKIVPVALIILLVFIAPIGYTTFQDYQGYGSEQEIRQDAQAFFSDDLVSVEFSDSQVRVMVVGDHNETEFRNSLPEDMKVRIIEIQTE
ncbi:MAG: TIGR00341 family protein [Nanohaloarchaea archaeon SW_7_46_7]|nr:MAG: TIGR00341 family protein [Nanohaloarchaea archaeon SW_7_46_7]